jgi:cysteine desulfurase
MTIYLDNNATTMLDPRVKAEIIALMDTPFGNPSSPHRLGQKAKSLLSHARKQVAGFFGCSSQQILFTSGGTEGAALAIHGLLKGKKQPHILSSSVEHACVFETLEALREQGAHVDYLDVGLSGAIRVEQLIQVVSSKRPDLIVLMAVNNETGVKNDVAAIADIAASHQIPLIVDGVAWLGKEKFSIPKGVSAMFFSGHKVHAPQGTGFIYLQPKLKLSPQILGGSQEFNMRGGTENLLGIVALGKAIELLSMELSQASMRMKELTEKLKKALLEIPGAEVNGLGERICNTVNISFAKKDGETLLIALDQAGVCCSLGSACSSGAIEPSRVLLKMGIPMERAQASLRFSLSRMTSDADIDQAIQIIKKVLS